MNPAKGYYCLVQYCPDFSRLEAANVGVILFCPDREYIGARMASGNDRIRRFFGGDETDYAHVAALKAVIEERLKQERQTFQTLDDLERFIKTRANEIQVTPPRAVKVFAPEEDLNKLFERLVGSRSHTDAARPASKRLATAFHRAHLQDRLYEDVTVRVPLIKRQITVPYGYQNGRFNLIAPVRFAKLSADAVVNRACKYAIEGGSLYDVQDAKLGSLKLVVVADFASHQRGEREVVRGLFRKHNVDLFPFSQVSELIEQIRTTAKPVDQGKI